LWKYYVLIYENGKMRPVATILRSRRTRGQRRVMEGVNLTKIYCKHFCKCHDGPPAQQPYDNQNKKTLKKSYDLETYYLQL
jgi:hypothetical protein